MKKLVAVLMMLGAVGILVSCASTKGSELAIEKEDVEREKIDAQLKEIEENGKFVETDGNKTITVSKGVMFKLPYVTYKIEDKEKNESLSVTLRKSERFKGLVHITIEIERKEKFPKNYGNLCEIFLNGSYNEKIYFSANPRVDFSDDSKSKTEIYTADTNMAISEFYSLVNANSVLVFIGSNENIVTEYGQVYVVASAQIFPNKLFLSAAKKFVDPYQL